MAIEFRLLGSVDARANGEVIDLGPRRQRSVLAVLLINVTQVVPLDRLMDRIWGERQPRSARGTLHAYVSRLRKALAGTDDVSIVQQSGGYLIALEQLAVDVHHFRRLIAQARIADGERALALFEQALGLWRGEAFANLDTPWLNQARDTLNAERRAAELARGEVKLRLGQHLDLLAELPARMAEHPLDEGLVSQFMLALYRSGRQADALNHYQETRLRLATELGASPSILLQTLHHQFLTADPALDVPQSASARTLRQLPDSSNHVTGRTANSPHCRACSQDSRSP
ncbi:AfsR/SARP family transcriptional regulator [Kibdelosporangium philippinense]|uniref:AfsR/SARP family transcriptional regulator n=1 Tax=Kibdelosporangium philippinense TaxID=211113 RepID=A0ABS8ZQ97_9PSEU|nr:AfsR/SARP family transcriptional regulator [Kibdelosporangium philippinense]MCE7009930.1 AfsR/SARP family transcriptional regulator [Kibdelosporangium philippinense]